MLRIAFLGALAAALATSVTPIRAQPRTTSFLLAVGPLSQDTPLSVESGYGAEVGVVWRLTERSALVTTIDYSHVHQVSSISPCYFVGDSTSCLHRAESETVAGVGVAIDIHRPRTAAFRPHLGVGAVLGRALAALNPGEARQFSMPQATLGLGWGRNAREWGIDVRVRRLDRWQRNAHGQGALLFRVGF